MYTLSSLAVTALRNSHGFAVRVEAWLGASRVQISGVNFDVPVLSGDVTVDASSRVRRKLSLSTPATETAFDALGPVGTELKVFRGIRLANGVLEWIPLGVFIIDDQSINYGPSGTITITAPDRWVRVQRALFERIRQTSGNAVASIVDLVSEAVPGVVVDMQVASTFIASRARWAEDRDAAIGDLAKAATVDVAFDPIGRLRVRNTPILAGQQPVWRVDAGETGVQLSANRTLNRQRTANVICIRPDSSDGSVPFPLTTLADMDPKSPTYVGGPFGRVVRYYSNPLIKTATQARAAAVILLDRSRSFAAQLSLTSVVNPALEDGDVIGAIMPRKPGTTLQIERHIIESVTVPLTATGEQSIMTRSSHPDDADDGGLFLSWIPTGGFNPSYITWGDIKTDNPLWSSLPARYTSWNNVQIDLRISGV